jgi:hypothetical protein
MVPTNALFAVEAAETAALWDSPARGPIWIDS